MNRPSFLEVAVDGGAHVLRGWLSPYVTSPPLGGAGEVSSRRFLPSI